VFKFSAGDFDYTFTNRELEDVLGFIERHQSGISVEEAVEDPNLPFFLPASVPLALQFQVSKSINHLEQNEIG
jgi:hypothetical protein